MYSLLHIRGIQKRFLLHILRTTSYAVSWHCFNYLLILQADQLTEEQIAGKPLPHWSFLYWPVFCILDFSCRGYILFLLGPSTGQPTGHKTGMNERAGSTVWKDSFMENFVFHCCCVINDVIQKSCMFSKRCWHLLCACLTCPLPWVCTC